MHCLANSTSTDREDLSIGCPVSIKTTALTNTNQKICRSAYVAIQHLPAVRRPQNLHAEVLNERA
ncbi:MAG TPA: hypothetical protein DEF45_26010 [Rhodopirellula sp.]|nr:hypothetical protein [Rhodopirellula sp.]